MTWSNPGSDAEQRHVMVEQQLRARGIHDERVLSAMGEVPRHEFVSAELQTQAYRDYPLPIGEEQTISQPFIIGLSLQALQFTASESVLEVGTGSGYQTALLCRLCKHVFSVERHPSLAKSAEQTLRRLGFHNVTVSVRDGSQGWVEHAPYDAMLVSAAAPSIPRSLIEQLAEGGKMVIPIGPPHAQQLQLVRKTGSAWCSNTLEGCRFVPLVGAEAY